MLSQLTMTADGSASKSPLKKSHTYATVFIVMVVVPTLLTLLFVGANFRPELSEGFIFVFFGITSAISIGVWSTMILAEKALDKRHLYFPFILTLSSAVIALAAAIAPGAWVPGLLDSCVSFLLVGLVWLGLQATWHLIRAEEGIPPAPRR